MWSMSVTVRAGQRCGQQWKCWDDIKPATSPSTRPVITHDCYNITRELSKYPESPLCWSLIHKMSPGPHFAMTHTQTHWLHKQLTLSWLVSKGSQEAIEKGSKKTFISHHSQIIRRMTLQLYDLSYIKMSAQVATQSAIHFCTTANTNLPPIIKQHQVHKQNTSY